MHVRVAVALRMLSPIFTVFSLVASVSVSVSVSVCVCACARVCVCFTFARCQTRFVLVCSVTRFYSQATGDLSRVDALRESCPKDFLLYSGDDETGVSIIGPGIMGIKGSLLH